MPRKPVGKSLRFEIFRRDGFTCQYCGQQPPDVVLHVDHITPVVEGGTNDEMNLITSCQDCNLGKGRKLLDKPQRPDADLEWLEMQQESAELRRFQEASQEHEKLLQDVIAILQRKWSVTTNTGSVLDGADIRRMIAKYGIEWTDEALNRTAIKVAGGYLQPYDAIKYTWGTLKNMQAERL
jgi:hypothetical protein